MFQIRADDLSSPQTRALLTLHLQGMHASSPPGSVFALDLSGLQSADVTVWSLWDGEQIAGIGALKALNRQHGEIKSMRTHPDHLRRGVGVALLRHIINEARARGYIRLSLETGSGADFEAAVTLYRTHGFVEGEAFGDYVASGFNRFFWFEL